MPEFKQLNRKQYKKLSKSEKEEFKKAYIAHYLPMVENAIEKHKKGEYKKGAAHLNAKLILAQMIKESGWVSALTSDHNNFGGLKASDAQIKAWSTGKTPKGRDDIAGWVSMGTTEDFKTEKEYLAYVKAEKKKGNTSYLTKSVVNGQEVWTANLGQPFLTFDTAQKGIDHQVRWWAKFGGIKEGDDAEAQIEKIKNAGYATSVGYQDSIINHYYTPITTPTHAYYKAAESTASKGTLRDYEQGLQEEYEKYVNELGGEGVADENILSYEDYYKQIGEIGSPRAQKLKRDSLQGLGPRVEKVEEKKEEEGVVGKVDKDGNLILTPTPVAPVTTISEGGEVDFGGQIQKHKEELKKKKENEKKKKEEVYQKKELVPLSDLTEEEINNLTNEERKEYGLQPTVDVVEKKLVPLESLSDEERAALSNEERKAYGLEPLISEEEKAARDEEERLRFEKEEEEDRLHGEEQTKKLKDKWKGGDKKVETVMVDKDGDGIPDTIDADAGEPTGGPAPENQLTVSTEEQVVIDEQEKEEAIETVETEEMEVLDANGNIKKITVPTIETPTTPTTVETEGVTTSSGVVEEKPELVKPKLKDFKTSSDYIKARMKYFKNVEDQDELDFDNELDDDEIKEVVDMEQNSAVIDSSKRNIFKTSGKSNIFNSIIGDIDDLAKGIQQELNNITKSINNRD